MQNDFRDPAARVTHPLSSPPTVQCPSAHARNASSGVPLHLTSAESTLRERMDVDGAYIPPSSALMRRAPLPSTGASIPLTITVRCAQRNVLCITQAQRNSPSATHSGVYRTFAPRRHPTPIMGSPSTSSDHMCIQLSRTAVVPSSGARKCSSLPGCVK